DGAELGALCEDAGLLELVHEHIEVRTRPVRDVSRGGEQPERREAEREDRAELDDVAAGLSDSELLRRRLELADDSPCRALDAADELPRDPEEVLGRRLVEPRPADEPGEDELGRLVDRAASRGSDRAKETLGDGDEEPERAEQPLALEGGVGDLRPDGDSAEHR